MQVQFSRSLLRDKSPYSTVFDGVMGAFPSGGLTLGNDGSFYGSTFENGPSNYGTVFKITAGGKLTVLHAFDSTDGEGPWGAPVQGTDGAFYGTTEHRGSAECGTVYSVTTAGTFKTLYNFDGPHGSQPLARLVLGTDGNFYGTTLVLTGVTNPNLGAIYKITPAGAITLLHSFDGTHGAEAYAPLMQASNCNFYGATVNGGLYGNGVVFEMSSAGAYTDLHDFDPNTEGGEPFSALIEGTNGVLYGTTAYGGTYNAGTIYSIPLSGGNPNTLYSFDSASGRAPGAPLAQHTNGIFYGDSAWGGSDDLGTFFSFSIGLSPFVRLATTSAKVGKTVEILGQGFTGTTAVSFNGPAATFHVASKTYLTAIVPIGATSGFIKMTTPGGTLKSNQTFHTFDPEFLLRLPHCLSGGARFFGAHLIPLDIRAYSQLRQSLKNGRPSEIRLPNLRQLHSLSRNMFRAHFEFLNQLPGSSGLAKAVAHANSTSDHRHAVKFV